VAAIAVSQFPAKAQDTCLQTIADQEFARQGLKLSDASQTYNQLPENSMMVSFTLPFEQYGDFEGTAQSGDEILANCPTVVAIRFLLTGRNKHRVHGSVNGQNQWFDCVRSTPLEWGQQFISGCEIKVKSKAT
jgi:hypothetical protein